VGRGLKTEKLYTDQYQIDKEAEIFSAIESINSRDGHKIDWQKYNKDLEKKTPLIMENNNQKAALQYLCETPGIVNLIGRAGAGKTTLLEGFAHICNKSGYRVMGATFQGSASEIMQNKIGCEAYTINKFMKAWESTDKLKAKLNDLSGETANSVHARLRSLEKYELNKNDVIIVDEANMVGGHLWKNLLTRIDKAGAKLVTAGDIAQAKSHESGDFYRGIIETCGHVEINEVFRQKQDWQKEASFKINQHNMAEGLGIYNSNNRIHWHFNRDLAHDKLSTDYINNLKDNSDKSHIALAYLNSDVSNLNELIRGRLKQENMLGKEYIIDDREFSVGDKILFNRNENSGNQVRNIDNNQLFKGVKNGNLGQLIDYNEEKSLLTVKLDNGRAVAFNPKEYTDFSHGYAMTINRSEGGDWDYVFKYESGRETSNLATVAWTRHREDVHSYADRETITDFKDLVFKAERTEKKNLISDFNSENSQKIELINKFKTSKTEYINQLSEAIKLTESGKSDSDKWNEVSALKEKAQNHGTSILQDWSSNKIYADKINLTQRSLLEFTESSESLKSDKEINMVGTIDDYIHNVRESRNLHNEIITTHPGPFTKYHDKYTEYKELCDERNSLASVIQEDKRAAYPVIRGIRNIEKGSEPDSIVSGNAIKKHSSEHYENQLEKARLSRMDLSQKADYKLLNNYQEYKGVSQYLWQKISENNLYKTDRKLSSLESDQIIKFKKITELRNETAFEIIQKIDFFDPYIKNINIDKLLDHAVKHESKEAFKKYSHATTQLQRTHFAKILQSSYLKDEAGIKVNYPLIKDFDISMKQITKDVLHHDNQAYKQNCFTQSYRNLTQTYERYNAEDVKRRISEKSKLEYVFRDSLGENNKKLSNSHTLRWGSKGSFIAYISGPKAGGWVDYKSGESGNIFQFVQAHKNKNFKESLEYLGQIAGSQKQEIENPYYKNMDIPQRSYVRADMDYTRREELEIRAEKIAKITNLVEKSEPIKNTPAEIYLKNIRKIDTEIESDLRFLPNAYDSNSKTNYPALLAIGRNEKQEVTSAQITYLTADGQKANVDVQKRSMGLIGESLVTIQKDIKNTGVIYMSEGVETALSIKQSNVEGKIIATLGISNFKKLPLENINKVIICADHDKIDSPAAKQVRDAALRIHESGIKIEIAKPPKEGQDFNDILQINGITSVRSSLSDSQKFDKEVWFGENIAILQKQDKNPDINFDIVRFENIPKSTTLKEILDPKNDFWEFNSQEDQLREQLQFKQKTGWNLNCPLDKTAKSPEVNNLLFATQYEAKRINHIETIFNNAYPNNLDSLCLRAFSERIANIESRLIQANLNKGNTDIKISKYFETAFTMIKTHKNEFSNSVQNIAQKHNLPQSIAENYTNMSQSHKEETGNNINSKYLGKMLDHISTQTTALLLNKDVISSDNNGDQEFILKNLYQSIDKQIYNSQNDIRAISSNIEDKLTMDTTRDQYIEYVKNGHEQDRSQAYSL
jgi:AAA domain/Toprim domain